MPKPNQSNIDIIFKRLNKFYKNHKFGNRSPFKTLISTILSQRTKDENTAVASERLYKYFDTPEKLANADPEQVEKLIRPAGFYRAKTKHILDVSRVLLEKYNGKVPNDFDKLMELPGVGRKTANCTLVYGFNIPAIPVDTHVHRISNRFGWVITKTPEQTEFELQKILPKKYWIDINEFLVRYGQDVCKPQQPRCGECVLADVCKKVGLEL
jgi:endonuclease-3